MQNYVVVEEEGGNKFLTFNGYTENHTRDQLKGPYTLSFDARTADTINAAFFVRGVLPVTRFNPANGGGKTEERTALPILAEAVFI